MSKEPEKEKKKRKEEELPPGVVLKEHEYDGIREYDQRLPNWWLFSWYITIVFFLFYWFAYFQLGAMPSAREKIDARLATIEKAREEAMLAMLNDEGLWEMSRDKAAVAEGEKIYTTTCLACHGLKMGGRSEGPQFVGEPLNDTEWKYGGNPTQVYNTVHNGSPDLTKGMPPWGPMLGPEGVAKVVSFILSHHEVSPPGEGPAPAAPAPEAEAPPPPAPGS